MTQNERENALDVHGDLRLTRWNAARQFNLILSHPASDVTSVACRSTTATDL